MQTQKLFEENDKKVSMVEKIIKMNVEDIKYFVEEIKNVFKMPKQANEENQYRILSFPWCISGNLLILMKFLNKNNCLNN